MRGSSRASVKALNDQDKTVATFKLRVKQLEKENSMLKNDNRTLQVFKFFTFGFIYKKNYNLGIRRKIKRIID